ncbi:hypothetical protein, partial [Klebsiella pneumoniae]|uniref:hypothetical protein n=1 Tax=Klebsiella pneumoniae TaxID=573 RepID=UPI00210DA6F6
GKSKCGNGGMDNAFHGRYLLHLTPFPSLCRMAATAYRSVSPFTQKPRSGGVFAIRIAEKV